MRVVRVHWILVCLPFIIASFLHVSRSSLVLTTEQSQAQISGDCDVNAVIKGLRETPTLRDTGKWWTGIWCGQVPFWRPLSSLVFWSQHQVFGEEFRYYSMVSVGLALGLTCFIWWGLTPLLGSGWATVATLSLTLLTYRPWGGEQSIFDKLLLWKNQPDLLAGIFIMLGLGLAGRGRWAWGLAAMAVAVCCKEIGFAGLVLLPLVLVWQRGPCKRVVPVFAVAVLLWAYRGWAIGGVGYQMGTNMHWLRRAALYYGGHFAHLWGNGYWWVVVLAAGVVLAVWVGRQSPAKGLLVFTTVLGVSTIINARVLDVGAGVSFACFVISWKTVVGCIAWMLCGMAAMSKSRGMLALGLLWMLIGAAPTFAATQVQPHAQWLGDVGRAIVVVAALQGIVITLKPQCTPPDGKEKPDES